MQAPGWSTTRGGVHLLLAAALALLVWAIAPAPPAAAQADLATDWPVIEVEPGSEVTVTLRVSSEPPQQVDLEVVEAPEGWDALLRGGGFVVHAVTAGSPEDPAEVDLEVTVPADAAQGRNLVVVQAEAEDGTSDRLGLDLRVVDQVEGAVSVEAEFPELSGAADDTFSWSLDLHNALPGETTFALQARGPEGWTVTARPSSEDQATTVTLAGGDEETIEVDAEPPGQVQADTYEFLVVVSGGGERIEVPLRAVVEGVVEVELSTPDGRLNASGTTGEVTRVPLVVTNNGSAVLEDVQLSAEPPADWEVEFETDGLAPIAPGESGEAVARISPADDAITGDYSVGIMVDAQGRTDQTEIRFQVETPLGWGAVGVGIIGLAVAALGVVFRRFGRR